MGISVPLGKLSKLSPREAWKHEALDFTPWLAEEDNLNALAESLGLSELSLVAIEHWVGDFKLDLLCTDGEQQVVIENQLEESDHKHLGQILAYAAGVNARKVIWIAERFRPEHLAAIQFLNSNTTDDLSFFAVLIELWRIEESPLAPKFEVVAQPNNWAKAGREAARAASTSSSTKQLQLMFWNELVAQLGEQAPSFKTSSPTPKQYLLSPIGRSGFGLNFTVNTHKKRFGVELYLSSVDAKRHFALLYEQKYFIEESLGFGLDWQELPDKGASRIAAWLHDSPIEDEERWNEHITWLIQKAIAMEKIFRPLVKDL